MLRTRTAAAPPVTFTMLPACAYRALLRQATPKSGVVIPMHHAMELPRPHRMRFFQAWGSSGYQHHRYFGRSHTSAAAAASTDAAVSARSNAVACEPSAKQAAPSVKPGKQPMDYTALAACCAGLQRDWVPAKVEEVRNAFLGARGFDLASGRWFLDAQRAWLECGWALDISAAAAPSTQPPPPPGYCQSDNAEIVNFCMENV